MMGVRQGCRRKDRRAFSGARRDFVSISLSAIASWVVFILLLYGLWKVFVWLNERVPQWVM